VLFLLAGLVLDADSVGALGADDGRIDGLVARGVVLAFRLALVFGGVRLFLRGAPRGRLLRAALALSALGLLGLGSWGAISARRRASPAEHKPYAEYTLQELADWIPVEGPYIGTANLGIYERALAEARQPPVDPVALGEALERMAETDLRHGRNPAAVELLEEALKVADSDEVAPAVHRRVLRSLGVANLRLGEADHCIAMHNPESCLFPIQSGGVWAHPAGAVRAGEIFEELLQDDPENLDTRWLLNVAHQVAGTHPDGVPPEYLIPASTFDADVEVGAFREIAGSLGVDTFDIDGGAMMDDLDGDGFLDLFTTTMSLRDSVRYYHNDGAGGFEDWTARAGLAGIVGGFNCEQADIDNDGRLDLLVLRGAWQGMEFGRQRNTLLHQLEDGSFEDVTDSSGLGREAFPTQVGAFADYDLDGDLDLFIGNEYAPCRLFTNDGRGVFADRAQELGVVGDLNCAVKGASWGDYDNDGDPDLYVSNYGMPNKLYRNDREQGFVDVAADLGVQATDASLERRAGDDAVESVGRASILSKDYTRSKSSDQTFVSWFWDMDNDGWLDLYVGGFGGTLADVAGSYLGEPVAIRRHLRVYRNDGRGGFVNVSAEMGVDDVLLPMGANYGDIDNDGFQDFYLGTGRPGFEFLDPNALYLNIGGKRFEDVTAAARVGHLQKGHGVAFGDLDNDGDLDLFAQLGGFYPADAFRDALFENPGNDNHWVTVQLRGVRSNHFGVGARLRAVVDSPAGRRQVNALCGSGASFGASSLQQELGLGAATSLALLEVRWPSGECQLIEAPPMDSVLRVTEGAEGCEVVDSPTIALGG